ncbi:6,7-dimetjyl-8-ribityllumazine synthase [Boletus edulis]|uniref:6,7-dimethyl-8-ribityllumazine synthase n=1 Tax=Boletus edulis BED1 TaxID=1328754 RepID=A0AAD4GJP1_BOLED|nr:6,7-dimetjyl-8-ribityllumazine synthase [Boletus edulis]KAF8447806.1 6,7-dimethyl-8-ribityllumazine synthase [Boletus edulis BED1]
MSSIKGPSTNQYDGSSLRIAIVHARWNKVVIEALVAGAISKLKESGVKESNIVVQSVPGSYELPLACSKVIAGSQIQARSNATDLLGLHQPAGSNDPSSTTTGLPTAPFDAVIAIGVLIKGATMHFEYISDTVSHALMRVQLDTGVPVIFGVLTALNDDQALERAGIGRGENEGHNHGEDWGLAAVEMATRCRGWSAGSFS